MSLLVSQRLCHCHLSTVLCISVCSKVFLSLVMFTFFLLKASLAPVQIFIAYIFSQFYTLLYNVLNVQCVIYSYQASAEMFVLYALCRLLRQIV